MSRKQKILIIYWVLYYLLTSFVEAGINQWYAEAFLSNLVTLPLKGLFVYVAVGPLMEKFFLRKRVAMYIVFYFPLLILFAVGLRLLDNHVVLEYILVHWAKQPIFDAPAFLYNVIKLQFVACIPFVIKLFSSWAETEKRIGEERRQKAESELLFLRSQFHPHFLFNSLNTVYSRIMTNPADASDIVLKICSLLRFSLYEAARSPIPLSSEIAYLSDYIDLQRVRFGDRISISFSVFGKFENAKVEPFLILPFIENGFKHCKPNQDGQAWITIQVSAENGHVIAKVDNSVGNTISDEGKREGGLGHRNVKRRLEMLYPDRHQLKCEGGNDNYYVHLKFPFADGN